MAKKQLYRYYFNVAKQYNGMGGVNRIEHFDLVIRGEGFDTQRARYTARELLKKDNGLSNYNTEVELLKVEEI